MSEEWGPYTVSSATVPEEVLSSPETEGADTVPESPSTTSTTTTQESPTLADVSISPTVDHEVLPSTSQAPDFRSLILNRLEGTNRTNRQFEPVFLAYAAVADELTKTRKMQANRLRTASMGDLGGSAVSNAQLEALRMELSEVYKQKSINDQNLLDTKKSLEECRRQLILISDEKTTLLVEKDKFIRRISELECSLAKMTDERTTIHDEWLAQKAAYNASSERNLELEKERIELITRIRVLQEREAEILNQEVDKQSALQQRKLQEQIASALADINLQEDVADVNPLSGGTRMIRGSGDSLPQKQRAKFEGNDGEITDVVWIKDEVMATCGSDKKVMLWRNTHGNFSRLGVLTGCNQSVTRLDLNPEDQRTIVGASNDRTARIWTIDNQRLMYTLSGHGEKVSVARFSTSHNVVTGSYDRTLKLWDVKMQRCVKSFFPGSTVLDLVTRNAMGGSCFISGHFDRKLRVWDGRATEPSMVIEQGGKVTGLCRTSDDNQLLVSTRDDTLSLLDLRNMQTVHIYSAEQYRTAGDTAKCVVSPNMEYCAAGSSDGTIFIWNLRTTKLEKMLHKNGHDHAVMSLAWAPSGYGLCSVDRQKTVCYWE